MRTLTESRVSLALLFHPGFLNELVRGPGAALRLLSLIGLAAVAALILTDRAKPDPARWWVSGLIVASALAVAGYGLREKLFVHYVLKNKTWSIFSTFFNPNPLGGFLAMVLFLALGAALAEAAWRRRPLWGCLALLLAAAIVPTHSKGAVVALAVGAAVFIILAAGATANRRRNLAVLAALFGLGVLVIALGLLVVASVQARLQGLFDARSAPNMFRILTWRGTLRMAAAHPILGIGPGGFKYAFMNYTTAGYTEAAHQNYLQIAAEQGFLGLAAFLWLIGAALFTGRRALARAPDFRGRAMAIGGIASIAVLLTHSLLDYDWYIGAIGIVFWLAAGLLAHWAHGRQPAAPVPEPQGGSRRSLGSRRPARARRSVREDRGRRLPWPLRAAAVVLLAIALFLCILFPLRNARAEAALRAADAAQRAALDAYRKRDRALWEQYSFAVVAACRHAAESDPQWAHALERYGLVLGSTGRVEQGEKVIRRAVALEPASFQPSASLGRLYEEAGRFAEAAEAYRAALERYPNNTRILRKLGRMYQLLGDREGALGVYRRMVQIQSSDYNKYRALGEIDVDTEYAYAHYQLGRAAVKDYLAGRRPDALPVAVHEFAEALAVIIAYQERGRGVDQIFQQVGVVREDRGPALRVLEAMTRWRLADAYQRLGRPSVAAKQRELALALDPEVERAAAVEDGAIPG